MKAIILAAGRGSRMAGLTEAKPKCLTPLAGKELLKWQIEALQKSGTTDIVVIGGYKKNLLESDKYTLLENPRWEQTNMVGTLRYAKHILEQEECIVAYADIAYHPSHIEVLKQRPEDIVILYDQKWQNLWQIRFENPLEDAESFRIDASGRLLEIGHAISSMDEVQGQYMGLLKFTPKGWREIDAVITNLTQDQQDKLDMTSLLQLLIEDDILVYAYPIEGKWIEADNAQDLETYGKKLTTCTWEHDWRW